MDQLKMYEAMFLLEGANPDLQAATAPAVEMLNKIEAQTLAVKAWDDRRLAYDVLGRRRGLYVLAYFKSATGRIVELEHNCKLDERILRLLVIRRETVSDEEIAAETPMARAAARGELGPEGAEGAPPAAPDGLAPAEIEGAPDALDEEV